MTIDRSIPARALRLAFCLTFAFAPSCGDRAEPLPWMEGHRTEVQLLAGGPEREIVTEVESDPVALVTVAHEQDQAGGEGVLRVLRLAPPAEFRVELPSVDPEAVLRFAYGLHWSDERAGAAPLRIGFELRLDGEVVHQGAVDVPPTAAAKHGLWVEGEVPVPHGGELGVSTSFEGEGPVPTVGFHRLEVAVPVGVHRTRASIEAPNVVLVLVDTLRADRLGCYGYERAATPTIDALARRGTVFESAWAATSWTWPSTASVLTSVSPPEHGVLDHEACYLAEELDTLAEALQDAGLTTAAFVTNPLIASGQNYDQGFERFWERTWARAPEALEAVLPALDELAPYRFFLYLHLTDPHRPYEPEDDLRARFAPDVPLGYTTATLMELTNAFLDFQPVPDDVLKEWIGHSSDLYDGEIASTDRQLARFVQRLAELELLDRTVIAFTSDHGEEFLDHGQLVHGRQLHEETLRIPLILAGPGVPEGKRYAGMVENRFLAPTLLALAGVKPHGNLRGESLHELIGEQVNARPPLCFSTELGVQLEPGRRTLSAFRTDTEHFVWGPPTKTRPEFLRYYDLEADPHADTDLTTTHEARIKLLKQRLRTWWTDGTSRRPATQPGAPGAADVLKGIGYLGQDDE